MTINKNDFIRDWNNHLENDINIRLIGTADKRTGDFEAFLKEFAETADRVHIIKEKGETDELPFITFGESWELRLIPVGTEFKPFLDLLSCYDRGEAIFSHPLKKRLKKISINSHLKLFVTTSCHNCPAVVNRIAPLPLANPIIKVTLIDGLLFPELSAENNY